jgi:thymidylate kinase
VKLREGFLDILRRNPKRCRLVDAAQDVDAVAGDVWAIVSGAL